MVNKPHGNTGKRNAAKANATQLLNTTKDKMTNKPHGNTGKRNAAKPVKRQSVTIRLPPEQITALDALQGNRSKHIERAVKDYLAQPL